MDIGIKLLPVLHSVMLVCLDLRSIPSVHWVHGSFEIMASWITSAYVCAHHASGKYIIHTRTVHVVYAM